MPLLLHVKVTCFVLHCNYAKHLCLHYLNTCIDHLFQPSSTINYHPSSFIIDPNEVGNYRIIGSVSLCGCLCVSLSPSFWNMEWLRKLVLNILVGHGFETICWFWGQLVHVQGHRVKNMYFASGLIIEHMLVIEVVVAVWYRGISGTLPGYGLITFDLYRGHRGQGQNR